MRKIERTECGERGGLSAWPCRRGFPLRAARSFGLAMPLVLVGFCGWTGARGAPPVSPLTEQETRTAQKLYHVKCAKCHKFYPPDQYTEEDWHMWMEKMAKKSKLKPAQSNLLSRYLDTIRTSPGK